ncbi:MAG TPA: hypothetical protein PLP01_03940 [Phycisphaerae bacterium]|nr:hypothetical protein [Phycisphaerae bacterium]HOI54377.1 hypothetical protein [Phycisphaerae bacterium]
MVDSTGAVFHIEHVLLKKGRWFGILPYETWTNKLVASGKTMPPQEFVARVVDDLRTVGEAACAAYLSFAEPLPEEMVITESLKYLGAEQWAAMVPGCGVEEKGQNNMSIEYHGWIALATSRDDWDDGDLQEAYSKVEQLLSQVNPEEGHWAVLTDSRMLPRMVYLNCTDTDSVTVPAALMKDIAAVFDKAYGELAALSVPTVDVRWSPARVEHYVLAEGKFTPVAKPYG